MTDITDTLARLNALYARMIDGQRSTITEQQSFFDEWPAIAAHIAALEARVEAAEAERAQIVAWLRVQGSLLVRDQRAAYSAAADAIEAGAHKGSG